MAVRRIPRQPQIHILLAARWTLIAKPGRHDADDLIESSSRRSFAEMLGRLRTPASTARR